MEPTSAVGITFTDCQFTVALKDGRYLTITPLMLTALFYSYIRAIRVIRGKKLTADIADITDERQDHDSHL